MSTSIKLSGRLAAVAALVRGDSLCDIGCDHGLLPVYLAITGLLHYGIATDISQSSLTKAEELITKHGLKDIIETRLGDGLWPIASGEVFTCCLAGIGGMNIISILEARADIASSFSQLILSPNRDHTAVRLFLHRAGFRINREEIIRDKGVDYFIIDAQPGTEPAYDEIGYSFGKCLLDRKEPLLTRFIESELKKTQNLLSSFAENEKPERLVNYAKRCKKALEIITMP